MSPELGSDLKDSEKFYPPQSSIRPVLEADFYILDYWVNRMAANITAQDQKSVYDVLGKTKNKETHFVFLSRSLNIFKATFTLNQQFPNDKSANSKRENPLKNLLIAEVEYHDFMVWSSRELKNKLNYSQIDFSQKESNASGDAKENGEPCHRSV